MAHAKARSRKEKPQSKTLPTNQRLCPLGFYVYICQDPMKIYDITVPIRSAMPVYEGDPGVKIEPWSAFAKGDSSNVSMLNFGAHTGTHVDAPAHFIEGARRIDALSLDVLIGPARVVRVPDDVTEIDPTFIERCDL